MIVAVVLALLDLLGIASVQILRSNDLPRYRPLIFKVYAGLALLGGAGAAYGATDLAARSMQIAAAVGGLGLLAFAQRAFHYHALRREIDLPPSLAGRAPLPEIEGPSAQAARRKAERLAKDGDQEKT